MFETEFSGWPIVHESGSECAGDVLDAAPAAQPQARPARPPRLPNVKRDAKPHGRLIRRAAVSAYVGPNGSGKSLAMIFDIPADSRDPAMPVTSSKRISVCSAYSTGAHPPVSGDSRSYSG